MAPWRAHARACTRMHAMRVVHVLARVSGLRVSIDLDLELGLDLHLGGIPMGAKSKTRVPRLTRRYTAYSSQLGA